MEYMVSELPDVLVAQIVARWTIDGLDEHFLLPAFSKEFGWCWLHQSKVGPQADIFTEIVTFDRGVEMLFESGIFPA